MIWGLPVTKSIRVHKPVGLDSSRLVMRPHWAAHPQDPKGRALSAQDVAEADAADVDIAVKAARKAFDEGPWPKMTGAVWFLVKCADTISQHFLACATYLAQ